MNWKTYPRIILSIQTLVLGTITVSIVLLQPEEVSKWRLYELFGATLASILTVFGLLRMKGLT